MVLLKRSLFLFWASWFSIAFLSNLFDYLRHFRIVSPSWKFVSNNFSAVATVASIYATPLYLVEFMFLGVLLLEAVCCILFWITVFSYKKSCSYNIKWGIKAFILSIILWSLFLLNDEFFIAYQFESVHLMLLMSQVICLLAIYFLPDDKGRPYHFLSPAKKNSSQ